MQQITLRPDQASLYRQAKDRADAMAAGYASAMRDSLAITLQIIASIPDPTPQEAKPDGTSDSQAVR